MRAREGEREKRGKVTIAGLCHDECSIDKDGVGEMKSSFETGTFLKCYETDLRRYHTWTFTAENNMYKLIRPTHT